MTGPTNPQDAPSVLRFTEVASSNDSAVELPRLALSHDQRRRSRLRVKLSDGRDAGLFLPRGTVLQDGDILRAETGVLARISAAPEYVSVVTTSDTHLLTRAAYHLGNRHVPLEIHPGKLSYPHDHVLDGMCRELGLSVTAELTAFEPERGGYGGEHRHPSPSEPARAPQLAPQPRQQAHRARDDDG